MGAGDASPAAKIAQYLGGLFSKVTGWPSFSGPSTGRQFLCVKSGPYTACQQII